MPSSILCNKYANSIEDMNLLTLSKSSPQSSDTFSLSIRFLDGSIGTVHYLANGSRRFPKERLEVFASGRVLQLDNFRKLIGYGWHGFSKMNLWRQDKGQKACAKLFVNAVTQGGPAPIPVEEIFNVFRITIELANH